MSKEVKCDVRRADRGGWECEVTLRDEIRLFHGKEPADAVMAAVSWIEEKGNVASYEIVHS